MSGPMTALKAQSLGSYRLLRKLGTGGMAEVFLAAQRMSGGLTRPVVIKAILPHLAEDEKFNKMFMREARVAAMLTHPNIVLIHDVTTLDERPFIVMEFLKGRDLWTVLHALPSAKKTVSPQAAAAIIAQAASALDYAHRLRDRSGAPVDLVHRDISPHNLFLTREGHVKVLDFGIAKSAYQQHRTESGVIKGKLPYMAPEQARGKDVDGRADQFSLGIIAEAGLSYVGLGAQPPMPSWGRMLFDAQVRMVAAPHMAIFPGLAIVATVLVVIAAIHLGRQRASPDGRAQPAGASPRWFEVLLALILLIALIVIGVVFGREFGGDAEASRSNVKLLPTAILYVDEQEAGRVRFVGRDLNAPEGALHTVLKEKR